MIKIRYLILFTLCFAGSHVWAQVSNLTDVQFNSLPGGKVELRFGFDQPAPEPQVYTIESPARIAMDLKNTSSKLKQKKHTLDLGNTQSVIVLESGGRTRVIVNLVELTSVQLL